MRLPLKLWTAVFITAAVVLSGCRSPRGVGTNPESSPTSDYRTSRFAEGHKIPPGETYTGRSPYMTTYAAPEPPPRPKAPPPPPPKVACSEITTGLIHMTKKMPMEAVLGKEFMAELHARAVDCAANVVITDLVPQGASYVKSEPAGTLQGDKVVWNFPRMDTGATQHIKIWFRADKEGTLVNCATVHAEPIVCASTFVGKPALAITKTGPATARLGSDVTYNITVRNTGSAPARNVVVTDPVPAGFSHASGQSMLTFNVGDMQPNESKQMSVTFKANQRGKICNVATAKSLNVGETMAEACTTIVQPNIAVVKTGTKEQFIGKEASYQIVVSNTGDTSLMNVVVTDTAPEGTRIVSASGATVTGNTAVWRISELKQGDKQTYNMVLTSASIGNRCNRVSASSAEGVSANSEACTLWKGQAALLIEVVDNPDPVLVGNNTMFTIRVTNQGSADDTNVKIVANFAKEFDAVSASGASAGQVTAKKVTFTPVGRLAPKQTFEWTITAKAVAVGDHRLKVELTSDLLTTPVIEEESTHAF